jgi:hypothetical protein
MLKSIFFLLFIAVPVVSESTAPVFVAPIASGRLLPAFPCFVSAVQGNVKYRTGNRLRPLKKGDRIYALDRVKFERKENKLLVRDQNLECHWITSTAGGTGSCGIGCTLQTEASKGNCSPR